MTAKEIYLRTLAICWIKLGLGLLNITIDIALLAILTGISTLFDGENVEVATLLAWLALVGIVNYALNHYIGYLLKAGHVAVISRAFKNDRIPDRPVTVGREMVKDRFGTSNIYFTLDKQIAGSMRQLRRRQCGIAGYLPNILPVRECCLGYIFLRNDQDPYKSAADSVRIYARNRKTLHKDTVKATFVAVLSLIIMTLVAFVFFSELFRQDDLVAFVISALLAWSVKYAFIDSWTLVKMMCGYMRVVPTTMSTT